MMSRSRRVAHRAQGLATAMAVMAVVGSTSAAQPKAAAPAVRVSAQVDKTTLEVGGQLTVTLTIEGEFANVELQPVEFPKSFRVIAQSRSSNISMEQGRINKSISLLYVLMPGEVGTFQLGPFQLTTPEGQTVHTDPLEIVVNKPVLPPKLQPSQRFIL